MTFPLTWIEKGILAVGQMPTSDLDILKLEQEGVRVLINLREEIYPDSWNTSSMTVYHIPVTDGSVPSPDQISEFLIVVQRHFERGEPVYVHCTAGCGRTGVMVTLWYCSIRRYPTVKENLERLRELRPCFVENSDQEKFVLKRGLELII